MPSTGILIRAFLESLIEIEITIPGTVLLSPRQVGDTIGADRLNDRVRNGIGCGPIARDTGNCNF